ncbi:MAG: GIY-YIG nuclease family protein [Spirochaetes bacterium]|jgi:putative endonuclease|nr:GIY-YIG nuclease family protein [Spirochaetota bacterium]
MDKEYYIYMLECGNGALYTGYTTDIDRRVREHLGGNRRAKFTAGFRPVRTAACWKLRGTRSDALKVEAFIKRMSRAEKDGLVTNPERLGTLVKEITAARVSVHTASTGEEE